jgi:hypothetical protein
MKIECFKKWLVIGLHLLICKYERLFVVCWSLMTVYKLEIQFSSVEFAFVQDANLKTIIERKKRLK